MVDEQTSMREVGKGRRSFPRDDEVNLGPAALALILVQDLSPLRKAKITIQPLYQKEQSEGR